MDTITMIRAAIRGLLKMADAGLAAQLRGLIRSGDDYASSAKPQIDWDDEAAREELIHSRARDGYAILVYLDSQPLDGPLAEGAKLLAKVLGQDLEESEDGVFRIARRVAPDRVISTVAAPRGALTYPPWSGEGLEVISLGPMAHLDSKEEGDNSMLLNRLSCPGVWGEESADPRDTAKARPA
jgi:hypothetical protein